MKKLTLALLLIGSLCTNVFGALQDDMFWEVRTTGNNNNGGCYDYGGTGTDYSQQDAAQLSLTDLAMTTGGTTLTSATGGFTSAMVDNCIQITAGTNFTAGFYEITAYTDTNTVTIDRDATNGTNASAGTGAIGGALAHIGKAAEGVINQNTVYVKAGTYQKYGANNYVMQHTADNNYGGVVLYIGYNTTRDDDPTGANRPVLDGDAGGANSVDGVVTGDGSDGLVLMNFIIQNGAIDNVSVGAGRASFYNCKITGAGADNFSPGYYGVHFSEVDNATSEAFEGASTVTMYSSYVHDNVDIQTTSGSGGDKNIVSSVFDTTGIMETRIAFLINNIFYNARVRGQGNATTDTPRGLMSNNIFMNNSTAIWQDGVYVFYGSIDNNVFYNNTNDTDSSIKSYYIKNKITTNPNLNDPANGDFTITSGSSVLNAGKGIDNSGVVGSYKLNVGVDQDDLVTGGGGGEHSYTFSN